ncbi:nucleotidyltransferase family protein [Bordetella genomosp. 1]|uniref:MobA-like NTP transferase domain-containing protein n=1 Tax=Bordetella genomosp. 1 TaxID=1395607 RepID=A0ABX4EWF9_9BORD|nr:nucleotidyltransferase family protein [Bordetella genomosp. 1]OZI58810.1 hypothetical protein CAL27_19230 [Bordetella genomosp. 1]
MTHSASAPAPCIGVLLAAGAGLRYRQAGGSSHKLLAQLPDGTPVALRSAQALHAVTPDLLVMVGANDTELAPLLRAIPCHRGSAPAGAEAGMGATLAAAARWLLAHAADHTHALVALADMPWIAPATLHAVADADPALEIVAPAYAGRRGHPVRFARALWPALAALSGDQGARALLQRHGVHEIAVHDAGILRDVDLPQDLTR